MGFDEIVEKYNRKLDELQARINKRVEITLWEINHSPQVVHSRMSDTHPSIHWPGEIKGYDVVPKTHLAIELFKEIGCSPFAPEPHFQKDWVWKIDDTGTICGVPSKRELLEQGISERKTLNLKYQGNDRTVIPLVYGVLKNGKEALLCYKQLKNPVDYALRLYHIKKLSAIQITDDEFYPPVQIDYYLTKHFKTIYSRI